MDALIPIYCDCLIVRVYLYIVYIDKIIKSLNRPVVVIIIIIIITTFQITLNVPFSPFQEGI